MKEHCELCGGVVGEDCGVWEGYTSCCNELTCDGNNKNCEKCYPSKENKGE